MSAGKHNIIIDQGSDFAIEMVIKENSIAKDITGYSVRGEIRTAKGAATVTATFVGTVPNPSLGTLKIELSNSITKDIAAGVYWYDIEIFTAGDALVTRILEGTATVTGEVTK